MLKTDDLLCGGIKHGKSIPCQKRYVRFERCHIYDLCGADTVRIARTCPCSGDKLARRVLNVKKAHTTEGACRKEYYNPDGNDYCRRFCRNFKDTSVFSAFPALAAFSRLCDIPGCFGADILPALLHSAPPSESIVYLI